MTCYFHHRKHGSVNSANSGCPHLDQDIKSIYIFQAAKSLWQTRQQPLHGRVLLKEGLEVLDFQTVAQYGPKTISPEFLWNLLPQVGLF